MDKLVIYQTKDSKTEIEVSFDQDTVWLTQQQISELFSTSRENITMHLKNIFQQEELAENSVCKDFLRTAKDGKKYKTKHYNLDAIISVGYRVNTKLGTQFRQWATQRLKDYLVEGYAINQKRLTEKDMEDKTLFIKLSPPFEILKALAPDVSVLNGLFEPVFQGDLRSKVTVEESKLETWLDIVREFRTSLASEIRVLGKFFAASTNQVLIMRMA